MCVYVSVRCMCTDDTNCVDADPGADDPCKECECQSFDGVYGWSCTVQACSACPDGYDFTDDGSCCGICEGERQVGSADMDTCRV
jgi:hypothetical protein